MFLTDHAACFLDLDGTLLDTEPIHVAAHRRWLGSQGIDLPVSAIYGNVGKGDREFYSRLMAEHAVTGATVEEWMAAKDAILVELYRRDGVAPNPGAATLLDAIESAGMPAVLVSSSIRAHVDLAMAGAGFATRLPRRICGDDVVRTKPDPEGYLRAVALVGLPAGRCLAVEDSPVGIAAARAAGCRVIALGTMFPPAVQLAAGAAAVIGKLQDLLPAAAG